MSQSPTDPNLDGTEPVFWKLSMGPGSGHDFPDLLGVLDWLRQGLVLVHKATPPMGHGSTGQGAHFVHKYRLGDYFYLCHGNQVPSIILLGQFTGPADILSPFINSRGEWEKGWASRRFQWIKTAVGSGKYNGTQRWWTPNFNSTFVNIPREDFGDFEDDILWPFFEVRFAHFGVQR